MTKRAASYDIDPVTYEEKERDKEGDNLYEADAPQMKNRKIYKLARKAQGVQLTSQSKPDLKIIGLNESLLGKDPKLDSQANSDASNIFKSSISGLSQATNLFSSLFSKDYNKPATNMDVKSGQVPKAQQQANKPKTFLFGSLFNQSPSSSIFSSNANNSASTNLFSLPNKSLFSGDNLFSFNDKPALQTNLFSKDKKNEEGEEEGDSAELQKKQQMTVDPSKSQFKFDYGEQNIVLKTVRLLKFKKDKGELLDCPLTASLLRDHSKQVYYITINLTATHKLIFSGLILKGKSAVKILNNKLQNLQILAFNIDPKQKKIENHILKLQISTESNNGDEVQFLQTLKQIIEVKAVSGSSNKAE